MVVYSHSEFGFVDFQRGIGNENWIDGGPNTGKVNFTFHNYVN